MKRVMLRQLTTSIDRRQGALWHIDESMGFLNPAVMLAFALLSELLRIFVVAFQGIQYTFLLIATCFVPLVPSRLAGF